MLFSTVMVAGTLLANSEWIAGSGSVTL